MHKHTEPSEKRISLRYPLKLLIEIKTEAGQSAIVTETEDLSQGGMSFYANWKLPLHHVVDITFLFGERSFQMKAEVTYSNEDARTWRFFTGVSFLDPKGAVYVKLAKQFIELIQHDLKDVPVKKFQIYEIVEGPKPRVKKVASSAKPFWHGFFKP